MKKSLLLVICLSLSAPLPAQSSYLDDRKEGVIHWLDTAAWTLSTQAFDSQDLRTAEFNRLSYDTRSLGLQPYNLLRNAIYAHRGYTFKSPLLQELFSGTHWHKPDPSFNFDKLSKLEQNNVEALQALEKDYDLATAESWLRQRNFQDRFIDGRDFRDTAPDSEIRFALNHLKMLPAELFSNYLLARRGYQNPDTKFDAIFSRLGLAKGTKTIDQAAAAMTRYEKFNMELIQMRELYEKKDAISYSMPEGVIAFPAIGGEFYLYRTLKTPGGEMHYGGLQFAWLPSQIAVNDHQTKTANLLNPEDVITIYKMSKAVDKTRAAFQILKFYFQHKQYSGYTDQLIYNQTDFEVPDVLVDAIRSSGIDYLQLLRQEISARHGVEIGDPKTAPIFQACTWYKPRFKATLETQSRLPRGASLTPAEQDNFALVEGEMIFRSKKRLSEKLGNIPEEYFLDKDGYIIVDLNSVSVRWVLFHTVEQVDSDGYKKPSDQSLHVGALVDDPADKVDWDVLIDSMKDNAGLKMTVRYNSGC